MSSARWILVWTSVACLGEARSPRQSSDALEADMMNIKMLSISVPGTPGEDYPIFSSVPDTQFTCRDKEGGGYYADVETGCQAYHTCGIREGLIKFSYLCPNGTIFDQEPQTCRWWYLVDCQASESFFFEESNIRGSDVSSASSFANSKFSGSSSSGSSSSGSSSSSSSETGSQSAVTAPPRRNQASSNADRQTGNNQVSDNAIYFSIPEDVLRQQIFNALNNPANAIKIKKVTGNRQQNSAGIKTRKTKKTVVSGNRTQNPPRNIKPKASTRSRATSSSNTIQTNLIEADYDYDSEEANPNNIRTRPTIPPSSRSLSIQNGKFIVHGG